MRGYNLGYERGVELIHKQQDRVYDVLEETRGPNLFDYGFTKNKLKKAPLNVDYGEKKYHSKGPKKKVRIRKRTRESNPSSDEDEVQQDNLEAVAEEVV